MTLALGQASWVSVGRLCATWGVGTVSITPFHRGENYNPGRGGVSSELQSHAAGRPSLPLLSLSLSAPSVSFPPPLSLSLFPPHIPPPLPISPFISLLLVSQVLHWAQGPSSWATLYAPRCRGLVGLMTLVGLMNH